MENINLLEESIFGSFYLADSEFALSVSYVQEVVNSPTSYTVVPLAPSYLKGLFNLRGTVIPVLDLYDLLKLKKESTLENQKIAIIELEGACVGLLFDKTGEVFKNNVDERSDFEEVQAGSVVSGVFKKNSGKRIVQILDVTKLFKLKNIPKDTTRAKLGRDSISKKRGHRSQCISFMVGPAKCSLPIADIQEIIKIDRVNESTLGIGHCIGTIDLRGTTVPVIDFASLLNYREMNSIDRSFNSDQRVIVMRFEKEFFGFMVESVESIISFFPDELVQFPIIEQNRADMFVGCITGHGDLDILLLDYKKILTNTEVTEITRGHSKLYKLHEQSSDKDKLKGGPRRTYITFKVDNSYAVAINEVKEIIDYPKQMLKPPGLKKHVKGVLNLRGELVVIVDARSMYLSQTQDLSFDHTVQKVLVFKKNNIHFGLIVDSVESIITFIESDKVKLPEMLYDSEQCALSKDISEAVEIVDENKQKVSLLILSVEALSNRAAQTIAA